LLYYETAYEVDRNIANSDQTFLDAALEIERLSKLTAKEIDLEIAKQVKYLTTRIILNGEKLY